MRDHWAGDGDVRPDGFQIRTNGRAMAKMTPGEVEGVSGRNRATRKKRGKEEKERQQRKGKRVEVKEKEEVPSKELEKLQRGKSQKRPVPGQELRPEGRLWKAPTVLLIMRPVTWSEGVVGG